MQIGNGTLGVGDHGCVIFAFGQFQEAEGVVKSSFEATYCSQRRVQLLAFAHQPLRVLRIVPERGVLCLGVQFVKASRGFVPVKDASSAG
jgi:hypothetical protein